jgi:hypothetical protein
MKYKGMSKVEKIIRAEYKYDATPETYLRSSIQYLLGVIDVIREDRNRMRKELDAAEKLLK